MYPVNLEVYKSGENPNNYQKEDDKLHSFTELKIQKQLKKVRDQKKALIRMLEIFFAMEIRKPYDITFNIKILGANM